MEKHLKILKIENGKVPVECEVLYEEKETVKELTKRIDPDDKSVLLKQIDFPVDLVDQLDKIIEEGGKMYCVDKQKDGTSKVRIYKVKRKDAK